MFVCCQRQKASQEMLSTPNSATCMASGHWTTWRRLTCWPAPHLNDSAMWQCISNQDPSRASSLCLGRVAVSEMCLRCSRDIALAPCFPIGQNAIDRWLVVEVAWIHLHIESTVSLLSSVASTCLNSPSVQCQTSKERDTNKWSQMKIMKLWWRDSYIIYINHFKSYCIILYHVIIERSRRNHQKTFHQHCTRSASQQPPCPEQPFKAKRNRWQLSPPATYQERFKWFNHIQPHPFHFSE